MATTTQQQSWPSGISQPLMHDNYSDHGGLIVVITVFCLTMVFIGMAFRVYAWRIRRKISNNDIFLCITTAIAWAQISLVITQADLGWGKAEVLIEPPSRWQSIYKIGYATDLLYIFVLGLSRITGLVFFYDVFNLHSNKNVYGSMAVSCLGTVVSLILGALRCDSRAPWQDISSECGVLFQHWIGITTIDIFSEIIVLLYPIRILHRLNMPTTKKALLTAVLETRVILIPLSVIHLVYVHHQVHSPDPSLAGTYATLTAEIHLTFSLLVHISSSMKPFLAVFEDENGLAYTESAIQLTELSTTGSGLGSGLGSGQQHHDHGIRRHASVLGNFKPWQYRLLPTKNTKARRSGGVDHERLANGADNPGVGETAH